MRREVRAWKRSARAIALPPAVLLSLVVLALIVPGTARGQLQCDPEQLFKLLPSDGAEGDLFGQSIAISGDIAIVGAWADDDNGGESGSAYLFDLNTGEQLFKLMPNDGGELHRFGISVAISGDIAVVGANGDDDNGFASGSAYLFDVNTGEQLFKLLASDGAESDLFGQSVAISGNIAIVGAYRDDDRGWDSGSAYLFDVNTGEQLFKLLASDGSVVDLFGYSVAIRGDTAIVGAYRDDDNGIESGSAYLFDVNTGQQLFKLLASDGARSDHFGYSVAISGDIAVVGANGDGDNGVGSGSAYLFDVNTGEQLLKLLPIDGAEADYFGFRVAISGDIAIVGASGDDDRGSRSGSAYLFDVNTGEQLFKLLPNDGAEEDEFGCSVAISGDIAVVGAEGDDDNGVNSGSAYLGQLNCSGGDPLALAVSDLFIGEYGVATVTDCTPGEIVYLLYSRRGYGSYYVSELNVTLDLRHPILAGSSVADQTGRAIISRAIGPDIQPGHLLWIQVAEWERTSNVVEAVILRR